jgi:drug/metabolite transporter (DMT)-like permease
VALVIVYVVWGSTYLGIRIAVETIPPYIGGALRFAAAGLLLGAVIAVRRGPAALRVTGRQLLSASVVGILLLAGGNGMVVVAEAHRVPSGVAALLVATVPLLVVVLRLITGDRPRPATLIGVLVGFGGLAGLVASTGGSGGAVPTGWALLVVAAAASWSVGSFLSKPLPLPPDPFVASVYEMIAGAVVLGVGGAAAGERLPVHVSTRSWLALGYLIVAGSLVAFTAYVWLLGNAPISLVSTYAYVNPAVAVALGALVVHEPVTPAIGLSGLVVVVGVALVVSTERRRKRPSTASSTEPSTVPITHNSRSSPS